MIPYTRHDITPEDEAAVLRALRSGYLTQGPEIEAFEAELAALTGARYAVAVNSGTAALHLAYLASGWRYFTVPTISFVATANAAMMLEEDGLKIHLYFADCNEEDGHWLECANPTEQAVQVWLGGDPDEVWDDPVIVDGCHGPLIHYPKVLATCFSFHPAKHVAAGEGGAIVTNDADFADQCRLLRSHGRRGTEMVALGYNYRMPEMSAALARSQLTRYHAGVEKRRALAARYDAAFAGHPTIQPVRHGPNSARHLYQVFLNGPPDAVLWDCYTFGDDKRTVEDHRSFSNYRDMAQHRLRERGVGTAIHYPVIPLQPYYRERYGYQPGQFPGAEAYAARTLSIPLFPSMTDAEQEHVIASVLEVCG